MPGKVVSERKDLLSLDEVYAHFLEYFTHEMNEGHFGDPTDKEITMGPLARIDLRDELHQQVLDSVEKELK